MKNNNINMNKYRFCCTIVGINKWVHIFLGIMTYGIWAILYFYCKSIKNNVENQLREKEQQAIEENKVDYLKFKLTGTTYDNRQDNIKYFSKDQIEKMEIEPYVGMTNKQIIESYEDRIWECAYQLLDPEWKLKKTTHDSEIAISVLFDTEKGYIDVGYIPKEYISKINDYYFEKNYKIFLTCEILGGKYKTVEDDDYGKEKVIIKELNYGIEVTLDIRKK